MGQKHQYIIYRRPIDINEQGEEGRGCHGCKNATMEGGWRRVIQK